MIHYYLYIQAGQTLDTDTDIYKVGVGESEAQIKKILHVNILPSGNTYTVAKFY